MEEKDSLVKHMNVSADSLEIERYINEEIFLNSYEEEISKC